MDHRSDEALLLSYARQEDGSALEELVRRHFQRAYVLALRALTDPATADDATQETFVALIRGARRFEAGRPFVPWFQTLLLNAIRKQVRTRERRARRETVYAERRPHTVGHPGDADLEHQELWAHVQRLPLDLRLPLLLCYCEGRTHGEVAASLGCPKGTASSRIRRGLERLRESLTAEGHGSWAAALPALLAVRDETMPAAVPTREALERAAVRATALALLQRAALVGLVLLLAVGFALGARLDPQQRAPAEDALALVDSAALAESTPHPTGTASPARSPAAVGDREDERQPSPALEPASREALPPAPALKPPPAGPSVLPDQRPRALVVRVLAPDGSPAAGVEVTASEVAVLDGVGSGAYFDASARTGAGGVVRFSDTRDAAPSYSVVLEGQRGLARGDVSANVSPDGVRTPVHVDLQLKDPVVLVHVLRGDEPLVDTRLWGSRYDHAKDCLTRYSAMTDAEGRMPLYDLDPGRHDLTVEHEGCLPARLEVEAGAGVVHTISLEPGATVTGRVALPPGATGEELSLRVLDLQHDVKVETTAAGDYVVGGMPPGEHCLSASLPGWGHGRATVTVEGDGEVPGPTIQLVLGVRLTGRLLDRDDQPAWDVAVQASLADGSSATGRSGEDGRFDLDGLTPGTWTLSVMNLRASHDGPLRFKPHSQVEVDRANVDVGDLQLSWSTRLGTVSGRVVGPDGAPVPSARLYALGAGTDGWRGGGSRQDGQFSIEEVPPGRVILVAAAGLLVTSRPRELHLPPSGVVDDVEVRLVVGGTLVGRILASAGRLATRPRVTVTPATRLPGGLACDLTGFQSCCVDPDGSFRFAGVPPGRYEVGTGWTFRLEDFDGVTITVRAGEEIPVELDERRAVETLRVRIDGAPGPVNGRVRVLWSRRGDRPGGGQTAELRDSQAEVRWIEPGPVRVVLELGSGKERRVHEQAAVVVPGSPLDVVFAYPQ